MKKEGIKRIIIISILLLICILCVIIGILKYNEGYGKNGDIRKDLHKIVSLFNKSDTIKNSKTYAKAKIINNELNISYIKNNKEEEIKYYYVNKNDRKYLSVSYSNDNINEIEIFSKELMEITSQLNDSTTDRIFDTYSYNYLYLLNLEENNIELYSNENRYFLTFPLNQNIYIIFKNQFEENDNLKHIVKNNIKDLFDELDKNNKFEYTKDTITLYIDQDANNYNIYINDTLNDTNNIYNSIMTVIKILNKKTYEEILKTPELFNTNKSKANYEVKLKQTLESKPNIKFIKVILKK